MLTRASLTHSIRFLWIIFQTAAYLVEIFYKRQRQPRAFRSIMRFNPLGPEFCFP